MSNLLRSSDLEECVRAACRTVDDYSQLTAESVLGLDAATVARLRSLGDSGHQSSTVGKLSTDSELRVHRDSDVVYACSPRRSQVSVVSRRMEALRGVCQPPLKLALVESSSCPLSEPVDDWVLLTMPDSDLHRDRYGELVVGRCATVPSGRLVEIGGVAVGVLNERANAGQLLINPFRATRAFSDRPQQRIELLKEIIAAMQAAGLREQPPPQGKSDADERDLARAVRLVDLLPTLQRALFANGADAAEQARQQLTAKQQRAAECQQQLIVALREVGEAQAALTRQQEINESLSAEEAVRALREVARIEALPAVRTVQLSADVGNNPAIFVGLHPLSIESNRRNYLLDALHFRLPLGGYELLPKWTRVRTQRRSPHPHVAPSGTTCWGQASAPLRQAMARREFATAVTLVCGWARIYNARSPYVRINNFARTELPAGWHPDQPVSYD